ncbi:MAG: hypothetical protein ACKD6O_08085 [Candidatus Bathyarchaeota archaeon]
MWWENLIENASALFTYLLGFYVDKSTAGLIVSMIFTAPTVLGAYILTRGTVSNSKLWITVFFYACVILFTYPIGWMPAWIGILTIVLPIASYAGYKISKIARGMEA